MISIYKKNLNAFLIVFMIVGILIGYYSPYLSDLITPLGLLFLNALKLLIIPVIFFAMLVGILNLKDTANLGSIGIKAIIYYTATTALAVVLGLTLVNIINPGLMEIPLPLPPEVSKIANNDYSLSKILFNIIPDNILKAASNGNVLGVIFFSIFLGLGFLNTKTESLEIIEKIISSINNALIWMVNVIMLFAPIGVLALIATSVSSAIEEQIFSKVGTEVLNYFLTVSLGLIAHGTVTLSIILIIFKKNPLSFFKAMLPAVTTAFSTASSTATLPITIDCLEKRANVSNKSSGFIAPLGSTINMDGTAIYEAIAAIFIANMYGFTLSFSEQFIIFITATVSAVGAAGIPGAGLITMTMVLASVGLPEAGIALIVGVDRLLDMLRTAINVWGDSIGALILDPTSSYKD
jgi:Na+/H+-dicarboxylate symporter